MKGEKPKNEKDDEGCEQRGEKSRRVHIEACIKMNEKLLIEQKKRQDLEKRVKRLKAKLAK